MPCEKHFAKINTFEIALIRLKDSPEGTKVLTCNDVTPLRNCEILLLFHFFHKVRFMPLSRVFIFVYSTRFFILQGTQIDFSFLVLHL